MLRKINDVNPLPCTLEDFDIEEGLRYGLLPVEIEGECFFVTDEAHLLDALNFYNKLSYKMEIVELDKASFERAVNRFLELKTKKDLENVQTIVDEDIDLEDFIKNGLNILENENSAPIIKFVNSMFYQAVKKGASDIHIETHEKFGLIRFRIDGILVHQATIDKNAVHFVINRIKVISNLDISEKRVPQDGRTQINIKEKSIDIRVSTIPTYYGEKVVMRLLMESEDIPTLPQLGFNTKIAQGFEEILEHSHGIVLVTGPTGSGKSTTLHAILQQLASPQKNIVTIEDPVEYKAENINQIQANPKVGLTFAAGLRSILRQDPDIIMVGEIRDVETAQIAIQAALTGHLVFSTLHTNNAAATITRLMDMGIEPFLLSSSLIAVLSQRLVRKLCHCKRVAKGQELEKFKKFLKESKIFESYMTRLDRIYQPQGCAECNFSGYIGRKVVGELFLVNDELKVLIAEGKNDIVLKRAMIEAGMVTLQEDLIQHIIEGITSFEEAVRVGLKDL